jgi:hypothetical protein
MKATMKHNNHQLHNLREGLEAMDLSRLVHNELHIDEFKSKMGNDEDIVVVSFKVGGKNPAQDLVNFIEKGYSWIIDADASSGEMDDGDYVVFVEIERTPAIAARIMEMLDDLTGLTGNKIESYRVQYHKNNKEHDCTVERLQKLIPSTPKKYLERISKDNEALDKLKANAGMKVSTKADNNKYTESLRIAAGIL